MDWELWGTFSVGDHLRRRAFVADILLYDRLVIPTPPEGETDEQRRWEDMGWRPDRQWRILEVIGKDRVVRVPWTSVHRSNWETRYDKTSAATQTAMKRSAVRSQMAQAAEADVVRIMEARKSFDWEGFRRRSGNPEEVDNLAHFTTRELLVDWSNMRRDTELFMGVPQTRVDAVVAYGSYLSFRRDNNVKALESQPPMSNSNLLNLFGWEFLVPSDSARSDEDLLKQAVEISNLDETKRHRELFHRWRREVLKTGRTKDDVVKEAEESIKMYRSAVLKSKIVTGTKYAFAVAAAGFGVAAVPFPPMGIPAAFAGLGSFVISESFKNEIPEKVKVAAMFYDARKRFGWYS